MKRVLSPPHAKPCPDLNCAEYVIDMRSRIGELLEVTRNAPACYDEWEQHLRMGFIEEVDRVHGYLFRTSFLLAKDGAPSPRAKARK